MASSVCLHSGPLPCLVFYPVLTLQDQQLFQEDGGWDVVSSVAEFWCSRVEWSSQDKMYHLKGEDQGAQWPAHHGLIMDGHVLSPYNNCHVALCDQELCPLTSTTQESTTLCTPTSWSRTGQT